MLASIITPTHRPEHLMDAWKSITRQSVENWEWIVVPNGTKALIPEDIRDNPKVTVISAPDDMVGNVGALKRFACQHAKGDLFVELDHDDMLTPDAIEVLLSNAKKHNGFFYSDFVNFHENHSCEVYSNQFGWDSYPFAAYGHNYKAMRAFDPSPGSLRSIVYAPNHVRAWSREHYNKIGGHDNKLEICDDYDLVCRSYLSGDDFIRIPECLYLYRLQNGSRNTFLERNEEIQVKQREVGNKYFYSIVEEWCRRNRLGMYDFGGRIGSPDGYTSVDLQDAEITHDVTTGIPCDDNSVGCIRAYDFLEHIEIGKVIPLMNEIYRVLAPGGWLISRTPSTDGRGAFQDPTHKSFWNINSFWYYTKREQAQYVPEIKCRFQDARVWNEFPSDWHRENSIVYVFADLPALKGQIQPGHSGI